MRRHQPVHEDVPVVPERLLTEGTRIQKVETLVLQPWVVVESPRSRRGDRTSHPHVGGDIPKAAPHRRPQREWVVVIKSVILAQGGAITGEPRFHGFEGVYTVAFIVFICREEGSPCRVHVGALRSERGGEGGGRREKVVDRSRELKRGGWLRLWE